MSLFPDMEPSPLVLTKDAPLRQRLFGPAVLCHPAKQSLVQLIHLLERFAVPSGVFLDPFGGSGSAMLAAAPSYGGMQVIAVELASHFLVMQQPAWQHFQCSVEMQDAWEHAPGTFTSVRGDSRDLPAVLGNEAVADLIITSPSYGGSEAVDQRKQQNSTIAAHGGGNTAKRGYQQIDRLPVAGATRSFGPHSQLSSAQLGYVDTIITSPPYQNALSDQRNQRQRRLDQAHTAGHLLFADAVRPHSQVTIASSYGTQPENIGNLSGAKYLAAMRQVWQGCAQVLRPGGILCCITRDCVKKGLRVPVGQQNQQLLSEAGLQFLECEVWRVPHPSFWRILQHQKHPDAPLIDTEEVWIFRKP